MNYSEFSLYGLCPLYDQTILVKCNICQVIIRLPQLAEHLLNRHGISSVEQLNAKREAISTSSSTNSLTEITTNGDIKLKVKNDLASSKLAKATSLAAGSLVKATHLTKKNSLQQVHQSNVSIQANTNKNDAKIATTNNNSFSENELKYKYVVEKIKSKLNNSQTSKQNEIKRIKNLDLTNHADASASQANSSQPSSTATSTFSVPNAKKASEQTTPNKKSNSNDNNGSIKNSSIKNLNKTPTNTQNIANTSNLNLSFKNGRKFDPDKHCGVVTEQTDDTTGRKILSEPCLRSLTCKKHSVTARRQVDGRSKTFNDLFRQFRDDKIGSVSSDNEMCLNGDIVEEEAVETPTKTARTRKSSVKKTPTNTNSPSLTQSEKKKLTNHHQPNGHISNQETTNYVSQNNPKTSPQLLTTKSPSIFKSNEHLNSSNGFHHNNKSSGDFNELNNQSQSYQINDQNNLTNFNCSQPQQISHQISDSFGVNQHQSPKLNLNYSQQMLIKHHPRPSGVTSFNARLTNQGGGYTLWNRRQDNLRFMLCNAFNNTALNAAADNYNFQNCNVNSLISNNNNNSQHQSTDNSFENLILNKSRSFTTPMTTQPSVYHNDHAQQMPFYNQTHQPNVNSNLVNLNYMNNTITSPTNGYSNVGNNFINSNLVSSSSYLLNHGDNDDSDVMLVDDTNVANSTLKRSLSTYLNTNTSSNGNFLTNTNFLDDFNSYTNKNETTTLMFNMSNGITQQQNNDATSYANHQMNKYMKTSNSMNTKLQNQMSFNPNTTHRLSTKSTSSLSLSPSPSSTSSSISSLINGAPSSSSSSSSSSTSSTSNVYNYYFSNNLNNHIHSNLNLNLNHHNHLNHHLMNDPSSNNQATNVD